MKTLSVYTLGGLNYAVWESEAPPQLDAVDIHWLPPVSPHIAAISVRAERTLTLFDLAVCLGLDPVARDGQTYRLLEPGGNGHATAAAFIVADSAGRAVADTSEVFALPDCLITAVIKTYTIYDSRPIAVIDLEQLFERAQKADFKPLPGAFRVSGPASSDPPSHAGFTLIESGDQIFALPQNLIAEADPGEAAVYPLQPVPPFVAGLALSKGEALAVVDLAGRLNLKPPHMPAQMLDVDLGPHRFRLRVGARRGAGAPEEVEVKPLPPLLQRPWRHAGALCNGEIYPILDLAGLFDQAAASAAAPPAYAPTSAFASVFKQERVEVVEFDVWGCRHALPADEVAASVGMRPIRPLSEVKPLVAGVAEYNGELLPVLDLARCFGSCAEPTDQWQMMVLVNGDFKALLLTERTYPSRFLPVDLQRELPFENPEALIYGCYPEDAVVRLIFNAHAMAMHFDRVRHVEFFHALAQAARAHKAAVAAAQQPSAPVDSGPGPEEGDALPQWAAPSVTQERGREKGRLSEEKEAAEQSRNKSEAALPPAAADTDGSVPVTCDSIAESSAAPDLAPDDSDANEEEPAPDAAATPEADSRRLPEVGPTLQSTAAALGLPTCIPEMDGSDKINGAWPDPSDGESASQADVTSPGALPVPETDRSAESPAGPLSAAHGSQAEQAEKIEAAEAPAAAPQAHHAPGDEGPPASGDPDRMPAGPSAGSAEEGLDADIDVSGGSLPSAEFEIEVFQEALREIAPPQTVDENSVSQLRIDAKPLPFASESPGDASDRLEAEEGEAALQAACDGEMADEGEEHSAPGDAQNEEPVPQDDLSLGRHQTASDVSAQDDGNPECKGESTPAAISRPGYAALEDEALQEVPDDAAVLEEDESSPPRVVRRSQSRPKKARYIIAAALLLLLVVWVGWRLEWPGLRSGVQTAQRVISKQIRELSPSDKDPLAVPDPKSTPAIADPAAAAPEAEAARPGATLSFEVEPLLEPGQIKILDKDGRLVIYRVRKGDTLWGISKRYTGSGFNYPKLAEDNAIENPDLIFPRQRITVK